MPETGSQNIPKSLYFDCDDCGECLHGVLKGKAGGKSLTVLLKCSGCGKIAERTLPVVEEITVPIIVSWISESERKSIRIDSTGTVSINDEYVVDGTPVLITGIESGGRRLERCLARNIDVLWAKKFDKVRIRVSVTYKKGKTKNAELLASPDDTFAVGESVRLEDYDFHIYSIKKEAGPMRWGSAKARDIVRIYVKPGAEPPPPQYSRKRGTRPGPRTRYIPGRRMRDSKPRK